MSKKKSVEGSILELCSYQSDLVIIAKQIGNAPAMIARFSVHPIRNAIQSIEWTRTYLRFGEPTAGTQSSNFEFCLRVYLREQELREVGHEIKATKLVVSDSEKTQSIAIIEKDPAAPTVLFVASNPEPGSVRALGEILSKVFNVELRIAAVTA